MFGNFVNTFKKMLKDPKKDDDKNKNKQKR